VSADNETTSAPADAEVAQDAVAGAPEASDGAAAASASGDDTVTTSASGDDTVTTTVDAAAPSPEELIAPFREERDRLKDQLLRLAAEYDNYRKRTRKDLEEAERRGCEETVRELLPVFDNLERAIAAAGTASDVGAIVAGLKMVLRLFEDHLGRIGVTRVAAVGERFDPAVHDAIQQVETDEHPPGTVIAELAAGYKLGDRLVRPASVVVARKPSAAA
jgi:molecular chaperone GrpE